MGIPLPIIFVIAMIMGMFAIAAFILYKKRDSFLASNNTIDKPINTYTEQEEK